MRIYLSSEKFCKNIVIYKEEIKKDIIFEDFRYQYWIHAFYRFFL